MPVAARQHPPRERRHLTRQQTTIGGTAAPALISLHLHAPGRRPPTRLARRDSFPRPFPGFLSTAPARAFQSPSPHPTPVPRSTLPLPTPPDSRPSTATFPSLPEPPLPRPRTRAAERKRTRCVPQRLPLSLPSFLPSCRLAVLGDRGPATANSRLLSGWGLGSVFGG